MREIFEKYSQNKNFLMFITSITYILGLYSYFTHYSLFFCLTISMALVILLHKNVFSPRIILLWFIMFYFGYINACVRIQKTDELYSYAPNKAEISGQVISIPNKSKSDTVKFFLSVNQIKINNTSIDIPNNKTLVSLKLNDTEITPLNIGNSYTFSGKLSQPFISTNSSQFSYAEYLRNYHAYTTFYTDSSKFYEIPSQLSLKWKVIQGLNNARIGILKSHSRYMGSPNIEILGGVVFGDDAIAPPEYIKSLFINSGLLHILAASGMNVAFIYGFLYQILKFFRVPYNISVISGIFVVILYSLMTGLGASVIRAAIMLIFILIGKLINRDAHSISLLSFVALLMLVYNPAYINDVGFQLSFIVTFGLLLTANVVMKYVEFMPNWLSGAIFVPIIAQIWVIPIQMYYFNTISLYSVFANILAMPFLAVISFGGFISSILALISPISDFICRIFDFCLNPMLDILVFISRVFAELPNSLLVTTHPSIFQVILYYTILMLVIYLLSSGFKNRRIIGASLALTLFLCLTTFQIPNHNFEVIAFDVGNGDAFLLKTPDNHYGIIDTGNQGYNGYPSKAKIILLKYLHDKGIKNLDFLILTHFDSDHAGGAVDLIDNLEIGTIYVNSLCDKSNIARQVYRSGKQIREVSGKTIIFNNDGFCIELNRANPNLVDRNRIDNESSILALVKYNKFSMLFAGDAGVSAFQALKRDIPRDVTIFKVGHHGAKRVVDRDMINYLNPKISIISVGRNIYGHPSPYTMKYLEKSITYRTDIDHAIKVIVDKHSYKVLTYDSRKKYFVLSK